MAYGQGRNYFVPHAKRLLKRSGAHRLLPRSAAGIATIFTLHRVCEDNRNDMLPSMYVSRAFLEATLDHIIAKGYRIVSLDGLLRAASGGLPERPLAVFTFDDGYRDNATIAAPIFARRDAPWTLLLTTGLPDRTCNYWWGMAEHVVRSRLVVDIELPGLRKRYGTVFSGDKKAALGEILLHGRHHGMELGTYLAGRYGLNGSALLEQDALGWSDLRALAEDRNVTIGSHTMSHRALSTLSLEHARAEITGGRNRIRDRLGIEARHFAFPFGTSDSYSRDHVEIAKHDGCATVLTTRNGNVGRAGHMDFHSLPRNTLLGNEESLGIVDWHLSGAVAELAAWRNAVKDKCQPITTALPSMWPRSA